MTSPPLQPGTTIGRYVVEGRLSDVAFDVRSSELGMHYTLQLVATSSATRTRQRAETLANLRHPNLMGVLDLVEVAGVPALVTERVHGPTLEALLRERALTPAQIDRLGRDVLRGMAAAHACGLVHGALNPSVVRLEPFVGGMVAKVGGFGRDEQATRTDDVRALGALLKRLIGNADVPPRMRHAFQAAMHDDPLVRWADAGDLLKAWCDEEPPLDAEVVWDSAIVERARVLAPQLTTDHTLPTEITLDAPRLAVAPPEVPWLWIGAVAVTLTVAAVALAAVLML